MLKREGWNVNAKRVYRLWREAGLMAHRPKPTKRRRLGSSANSCIRLKPDYPNHGWSYDFLFDATEDGRRLKWMPVLDEYTRECLALEVERSREFDHFKRRDRRPRPADRRGRPDASGRPGGRYPRYRSWRAMGEQLCREGT